MGFAWGVVAEAQPPIVVIRGGYGIFYNRFQSGQILQADRLNGVTQQQFIINNPTCFPGVDVAFTNFLELRPDHSRRLFIRLAPRCTRPILCKAL